MNRNLRVEVPEENITGFILLCKIWDYYGYGHHGYTLLRSLCKTTRFLYDSEEFNYILPNQKVFVELDPNEMEYVDRFVSTEKPEIIKFFDFKFIVNNFTEDLFILVRQLFEINNYPSIYIRNVYESDGDVALRFIRGIRRFDPNSLIEIKIRLCCVVEPELLPYAELENWNLTDDVLEGFREYTHTQPYRLSHWLYPLALIRDYRYERIQWEWGSLMKYYTSHNLKRLKPQLFRGLKSMQIEWLFYEIDERKNSRNVYKWFKKFMNTNIEKLRTLENIWFILENSKLKWTKILKRICDYDWNDTKIEYSQHARKKYVSMYLKIKMGMILMKWPCSLPKVAYINNICWVRFDLKTINYIADNIIGIRLLDSDKISFNIDKIIPASSWDEPKQLISQMVSNTPMIFFKKTDIYEFYSMFFIESLYPINIYSDITLVLNWRDLVDLKSSIYCNDIILRENLKIILDFSKELPDEEEESAAEEMSFDPNDPDDEEFVISPEIENVKHLFPKIIEIKSEIFDRVNFFRMQKIIPNTKYLNNLTVYFNDEEYLEGILSCLQSCKYIIKFFWNVTSLSVSERSINNIREFLRYHPTVEYKIIIGFEINKTVFQNINPLEPKEYHFIDERPYDYEYE